jgi:heme exporter protein A
MNLFSVESLSCKRNGKTIFNDVNFSMQAGDMLIISGANGSGKTSLLRQLAGLLPLVTGKIQLNGESAAEDLAQYQKNLQFIGHLEGLKPELTVLESMNYWRVLRGQSPFVNKPENLSGLLKTRSLSLLEGAADKAIQQNKDFKQSRLLHSVRNDEFWEILAMLDLEKLYNQPVRRLSAGQRRRLALTRLLLDPVDLWLLDEPATALDNVNTEKLVQMINQHCANGGMAVVVTHHDIGLQPSQSFYLSKKVKYETIAKSN